MKKLILYFGVAALVWYLFPEGRLGVSFLLGAAAFYNTLLLREERKD